MNEPARLILCATLAVFAAKTSEAQITSRPSPPPDVAAESESWYLSGEPITYAGNLYYPTGPRVFFSGNEMVRSGSYGRVPLYSKTTIEPYSMVFVPLTGGLMQPYERRRTGELAGTVGSSAPSFPVSVASEAPPAGGLGATVQAPAPPTQFAPALFPAASLRDAPPGLGDETRGSEDEGRGLDTERNSRTGTGPVEAPTARPTGTSGASGRVLRPRASAPISAARLAETANGAFVEFNRERWFISGAPSALDSSRMTRIGELEGFPIYARDSEPSTIYVPVTHEVTDVVVPYSRRQGRQSSRF